MSEEERAKLVVEMLGAQLVENGADRKEKDENSTSVCLFAIDPSFNGRKKQE